MRFTRADMPHVLTLLILGTVAVVVVTANHVAARRSATARAPVVEVDQRPSFTSREGLQQTIEAMEKRLREQPADSRAASLLADALMRQARVTGHAGVVLRAESALKKALDMQPADYEAGRMLSAVYLSEHRFREAIHAAERLRDMRPRDDWNYGVIGDGHLELGEYDEAFAAFQKMLDLRPTAGAYARASYALELQGQLDRAIEAMKLSTDATPPTDQESMAWHHAQLGDLYRQAGRFDEAAFEYAWAEHSFPGHPFSQLGAARLAEATGDLEHARAAYERAIARQSSPDALEKLGDVYERLGRANDAARAYALAEAAWRVDAPNPAALARFLAEHDRKLDEAVRLAEAAATDRRDIFTEDALAWACFKAGRVREASDAIARAQRTGTRDRSILFHAAAIAQAQGHIAGARQLARRALQNSPRFDIRLAPAARALAASD